MDIEKIAKAIEVDAGISVEGLREGLAEMKAGIGRINQPEPFKHPELITDYNDKRMVCVFTRMRQW
jgi:hypothetical protein